MRYRLYTYDLWGNEEDGYEVNNVSASEIAIDIDPNEYDKAIIEKIKAAMPAQQQKRYQSEDFSIEGGGTPECFIWITHKGIPFCEFRPEEEVIG